MVQAASVRNDPEANFAEINATLARYAADVDLVLFPELFLTGYDLTHEEVSKQLQVAVHSLSHV